MTTKPGGNNIFSVQFLGAAGTVTGSKFLVTVNETKILVDCGLFQGLKQLRELNWQNLPVDPSTIDFVLLTHAHLDHSGYLPRLVKYGFKGQIWATEPTRDIAKIILEDSAHIQEEDTKRANDEKFTRHHPALPLYDSKDVEKTLPLFCTVQTNEWIKINEAVECRYRYNGHILGSCFIELRINGKILVFSGDIGKEEDSLMLPPVKPEESNILFIESTYGNRNHPLDSEEKLAGIINKAFNENRTVIIPGFAVERIQVLMHLLWKMRKDGSIPRMPVYMDSPMGTNVLKVFDKHLNWHKLPSTVLKQMSNEITLVKSVKETYQLAASPKAKIIIAGSGMASGGRVLTYFAQYLGDPNATIVFAGYQAEGTRGRDLLNGAKEIKLYGKYFTVKAQIENVEGLSAHAGQKDLMGWISKLTTAPEEIFIIHGEKDASLALKKEINKAYGWNSTIPELGQTFTFGSV